MGAVVRVEYVGPFDAVEVSGRVVAKGDVVEVAAALGKSLCEQESNWRPVAAKGNKKEGQS